MSTLQEDVQAARLRLSAASDVIGGLRSEIDTDLSGKFSNLYSTICRSRDASLQILARHQSRYLSLDLFRSSSQYAGSLAGAVNELIATLATAFEEAAGLHTHSKSVFLRLIDAQNAHLGPAKERIQILTHDISGKQSQLAHELEAAKKEQSAAQDDKSSVQKAIEEKEKLIASKQAESDRNNQEVQSLNSQLSAAQQERQTENSRAFSLREEAEKRRWRGALVGIFTLGAGLGWMIYDLIEADNCADRARNAESRCADLSQRIRNIEGASDTLNRSLHSLKTELLILDSSKSRLADELITHDARISQVVSGIEDISSKANETEAAMQETQTMEAIVDKDTEETRFSVRQVLDFKQKLDSLKAELEAQGEDSVTGLTDTQTLETPQERIDKIMSAVSETSEGLVAMAAEMAQNGRLLQEH